jgi:hypothetical protein
MYILNALICSIKFRTDRPYCPGEDMIHEEPDDHQSTPSVTYFGGKRVSASAPNAINARLVGAGRR